jgi:hypothetical protein
MSWPPRKHRPHWPRSHPRMFSPRTNRSERRNRLCSALGLLLSAAARILRWSQSANQVQGLSQAAQDSSSTTANANVEAQPVPASNVSGRRPTGLLEDLAPIESEPDEIRREAMLEDWIERIEEQNIPPVLEAMVGLGPTDLTNEVLVRLLRRWAETSPRAAADWALGLPEGGPAPGWD